MKYIPFFHQDHEANLNDCQRHLMVPDRAGEAFCIDIMHMDGIVFMVSLYDEKPADLADKAVEQMKARELKKAA